MYRIGVDLGGTNIVAGVVDEFYKIVAKAKRKTACPRPAGEILADISACVNEAVKTAGITMDEVKSIGIGTPGSVNKRMGIIEYANNLGFDKVPARDILLKYFDKPIYIENDANCAALGEAVAGAGGNVENFVAITLGTGVGSGIIVNGKIVNGCNDAAGEMGHSVIVVDGEPCTCGRKGCWEAYSSATALVRQTKAAMEENKASLMWEVVDGDISKVNGRTAFDAMRKGDTAAKQVVDTYIRYLAAGVTNVVNTFQPDVLCIGGGIGCEGEPLLAPVREYVAKERYSIHCGKQTQICSAVLGNDAGVIGAALLDE
ncbi:MAG: ROK family protein [Clostridia bacterium]|nr:ROK family protein [Clostridia bacterium]